MARNIGDDVKKGSFKQYHWNNTILTEFNCHIYVQNNKQALNRHYSTFERTKFKSRFYNFLIKEKRIILMTIMTRTSRKILIK